MIVTKKGITKSRCGSIDRRANDALSPQEAEDITVHEASNATELNEPISDGEIEKINETRTNHTIDPF